MRTFYLGFFFSLLPFVSSFGETKEIPLTYFLGVSDCPAERPYCGNYHNPTYAERHHKVLMTKGDWGHWTGTYGQTIEHKGHTFSVDGKVTIYARPNSYVSVVGFIYEKGHKKPNPSFNFTARTVEELTSVILWGEHVSAGDRVFIPAFKVGELKF